MLALFNAGPMRLDSIRAACSRRCGARLLASIAPCWRRPGLVLLPQITQRDVRLHAKRGRPKKPEMEEDESPPEEDPTEAAVKPKRGRKSKKEKAQEEARDLLNSQQVDLEVLEEFKARAAAEEAQRKEVMGSAGEDDPRRVNFHRALLTASNRGFSEECARIIDSMNDAGLTPGPRAVHVWAYSYIKRGDGPGARQTAEEGRELYGASWIPETYVALIHGALTCTPGGPDLVGALEVWVAMQDADANPQLGFTFLAKELFRLRYSALAMQVVAEGYAAGYKPDQKLAALVIEQLCKQGLMTEARAEMQRLLDAGLQVGPEHYDTILRLQAAGGDLQGAKEMIQTFYDDPRFSPPRASSYTALIKGLASSLRLRGGPQDPQETQLEGAEGESAGAGGAEARKLYVQPDQLDASLRLLKDEMVSRGLRPVRETYAAMVEAAAAVGDLDSAMGHYETMTRAKGSPALLRKKYLGHLVVALLLADRPIDALRLVRDCSNTASFSDARLCVTLPASASAPLPGPEAGGRSVLTSWLPAHHEVMSQRRGQRTSVMTFMREADMSSRREVDGVVLGLGGCVVTEDGLFVPPTKMTLPEMRVELQAAGVELAPGAGRKELTRLIKDRRSRLPPGILDMQVQLEAEVSARLEEQEAAEEAAAAEARAEAAAALQDDDEDEGGEQEMEFLDDPDAREELDRSVIALLTDESTFEGGETMEDSATFRAAAQGRYLLQGVDDPAMATLDEEELGADEEDDEDAVPEDDDMEEDEEEDDAEDMAEAFGELGDPQEGAAGGGGAAGARRARRRQPRRGALLDDDEDDEDDDELGLDDGMPPLTDDLGTDLTTADDLDWDFEGPDVTDADVILDQILTMPVFDSSRYNDSAGMTAATRLVSCWVATGGQPTPADLVALYEGATLEGDPKCAADVAEMLPPLVVQGVVDTEQLTEMLVALANVCLLPGNPDGEAADRVVTLMEETGLQVPADVLSALQAAMGGRRRMRESVIAVAGGTGLVSVSDLGDPATEGPGGAGEPLALGPGEERAEAAEAQEREEEEQEEEEQEEGEETALVAGEEEEYEEEYEEYEEEVFGEYEDDPMQLELEKEELARLFEQDNAEDDLWLDELDEEQEDVLAVRAAAETEAAQAEMEAAVAEVLERVRERNPWAAQLMLQQLELAAAAAAAGMPADAVLPGFDAQEQHIRQLIEEVNEERAAAAAAARGTDQGGSGGAAAGQPGALLLSAGAGEQGEAGAEDGEGAEEEVQGPVGQGYSLEDLEGMAAEAEWETSSLMDLHPAVLAGAAELTMKEMEDMGLLTAEDQELLSGVMYKAKLLQELAELSDKAAEAHPDGPEAAQAEVVNALGRIYLAETEAVTLNEIRNAAIKATVAGIPLPEDAQLQEGQTEGEDEALVGDPFDEAFGEVEIDYEVAEGEEDEDEEGGRGWRRRYAPGRLAAEEGEEGEGEEEEDEGYIRPEDLEPGVDTSALGPDDSYRLQLAVYHAEQLLEKERQAQRELRRAARAEAGLPEADEEAAEADEEEDEDLDVDAGLELVEAEELQGAGAQDGLQGAGLGRLWTEGAADKNARDVAFELMLEEANQRGNELTPMEEVFLELIEKGDPDALEEALGPELLTWFAEDIERVADEHQIDLDKATGEWDEAEAEAGGEGEGEGDDEDGSAEVFPGWHLSDHFMDTFDAVVREREQRAAITPGYDPDQDSPEGAMLDTLLAMANGYRPQAEGKGEEAEELAPADAGEGEDEGEQEDEAAPDPAVARLRRELEEALRAVDEAEDEDQHQAAQAWASRVMQRQLELMAKRSEPEEGEGEEGEEEPGLNPVPLVEPEVATELLEALRASGLGSGPFFGAENPEGAAAGVATVGWEEGEEQEGRFDLWEAAAAKLAARAKAAAEEEEEEEEGGQGQAEEGEGPGQAAGGRGRGRRGGAGRGRKSTR